MTTTARTERARAAVAPARAARLARAAKVAALVRPALPAKVVAAARAAPRVRAVKLVAAKPVRGAQFLRPCASHRRHLSSAVKAARVVLAQRRAAVAARSKAGQPEPMPVRAARRTRPVRVAPTSARQAPRARTWGRRAAAVRKLPAAPVANPAQDRA